MLKLKIAHKHVFAAATELYDKFMLYTMDTTLTNHIFFKLLKQYNVIFYLLNTYKGTFLWSIMHNKTYKNMITFQKKK